MTGNVHGMTGGNHHPASLRKGNQMEKNDEFWRDVLAVAELNGGIHNAHVHLNRAGTIKNWVHGSLSLPEKQSMIKKEGARELLDTTAEIGMYLERFIAEGQKRLDVFVDIFDNAEIFDVVRGYKSDVKQRMDIRVGAYWPVGMNPKTVHESKLFDIMARKADFIGSLPGNDGIPVATHMKEWLNVCIKYKRTWHVHVDQKNIPTENETWQLIDVVHRSECDELLIGEPKVWAIHSISPSGISNIQFTNMAKSLAEHNIGVICCPTAAIGMHQNRHYNSPTHNSIARVIDLIKHGVHVRIGADNINDIFSPITSGLMRDEIFMLAHALRCYDPSILGALLAGVKI